MGYFSLLFSIPRNIMLIIYKKGSSYELSFLNKRLTIRYEYDIFNTEVILWNTEQEKL